MSSSDVTIVVTPRDRFGCARQSLESVYQDTNGPFQLVYVDANSPKPLQRFLEQQSKEKGFELIRTDHYLAPCVARNLGAKRAKGCYVVRLRLRRGLGVAGGSRSCQLDTSSKRSLSACSWERSVISAIAACVTASGRPKRLVPKCNSRSRMPSALPCSLPSSC